MPAHHKSILKVGMQALGLKNSTINEVKNAQTAYRGAVQESWEEFATTPEAKELLASHVAFLRDLGAMK